MFRRLLIAFALCAVLALAFFLLLPMFGVRLPWFVPLLAFAAILAGTVLSPEAHRELSDYRLDESVSAEELEDRRPP